MEIYLNFRFILSGKIRLSGKKLIKFWKAVCTILAHFEVHLSIFKMSLNLCLIDVNKLFFLCCHFKCFGKCFYFISFRPVLFVSFILCLSFGSVCPTRALPRSCFARTSSAPRYKNESNNTIIFTLQEKPSVKILIAFPSIRIPPIFINWNVWVKSATCTLCSLSAEGFFERLNCTGLTSKVPWGKTLSSKNARTLFSWEML